VDLYSRSSGYTGHAVNSLHVTHFHAVFVELKTVEQECRVIKSLDTQSLLDYEPFVKGLSATITASGSLTTITGVARANTPHRYHALVTVTITGNLAMKRDPSNRVVSGLHR